MDHILTSQWMDLPPYDQSPANCSGDPHRNSCLILQDEEAKRDLVAMVRVIVSLLSLLGSLSIIITVLFKRQVLSPKIHPIFMLSIADCLLSLTWIVGGALWLLGGGVKHADSERVACFTVTMFTVILECVAVNLTLLYALLAYYGIKQKDFNNVYLLFNRDREVQTWKPWKTLLAYALAWLLPILLILIPFLVLSSVFHVIKHANSCSCWCLPYYGNVLPLAFAGDKPTEQYLYRVNTLVASYAGVIGINYLLGFIFLTVIYWKILRTIKQIRKTRAAENQRSYGSIQSSVYRGESKAKIRIIAFLTVFVVVGLINTLMSWSIFINTIMELADYKVQYRPKLSFFEYGIYLMQSCTLPLQGFLNALVYGWTRDDFLQVMATHSTIDDLPPDTPREDDLENSRSILVQSGEDPSLSYDFDDGSPEHREVLRNSRHHYGDLDTVEEVTEPEDSDDSALFDGRPRSI